MSRTPTGFDIHIKPSREAQGDFFVYITVYQANGSTPRPYAIVKLTNINTGESSTKTTDVNGYVQYILEDDLDKGHNIGDAIKIEQVIAHADMEYYITGNGSATYPTWIECENATRTPIKLNTARIKINTTLYPGGRSVNISQTS